MILSDRSIKEALAARRIVIEPLDTEYIQPASIDVRLDSTLLRYKPGVAPYIDLRQKDLDRLLEPLELPVQGHHLLQPGEFLLARTFEFIGLGDDVLVTVEGKSSLGRAGLLVHATSGYVDPGWQGKLTLQLKNVGVLPVALYRGMKIAQLSFHQMSTQVDRPYGSGNLNSRYQGGLRPI